jgi:pimeloyl-ACP methyl ester carboxylesterase
LQTHESLPLILFSGLAADASVFAPQKLAFPQLIVPLWPVPHLNDTLDSYSKRLAEDLRPHGRCVIGGASFGGIVALHVAQYLDPLSVLLIGSVRGPTELPHFARIARCLRPFVRFIPVSLLKILVFPIGSRYGRLVAPHISGLARQFRRSDAIVFKWSIRQLLQWRSSPKISCPIFQIHGERDAVIPIRYTSPDTIVVHGGHVISLTHPNDVNEFMRVALARIVDEQNVARADWKWFEDKRE